MKFFGVFMTAAGWPATQLHMAAPDFMTADETTRIEFAERQGKCTHPFEFLKSETFEDGNDSDTDWTCAKCGKDPHENAPPNPTDHNHVHTALMGMSEEEWRTFAYKLSKGFVVRETVSLWTSLTIEALKTPLPTLVSCYLEATKGRSKSAAAS